MRRSLLGIVILFAVSIVVFLATVTLPGDAAVAKLGRDATPESLAAFRAQYHLDEPVLSQYFSWLGELVRGHLGQSLVSSESVTTLIGQRIVNSLVLMLVASLLAVPLAVALGVWTATRRDTRLDHAANVVILALAALPEFVVAVGLIVLLATNVLHVFPAASALDPEQAVWSQLNLVWAPAIALALICIPYVARMIRQSTIEVLESDYVAMARLKGLSERRVIWRHALVNGAGPTVQAVGLTLGYLAGSTVVVETVFQYPGIGLALYEAVQNRDLPVIQALVLLIAAAYLVINIATDLITILISPQVRTALK